MNLVKYSLLLAPLLTLAVACSDKSDSPNTDLITYDFKLQMDNMDSLNSEKKALIDNINNGKPVSFKSITGLYKADHIDAYANQTVEQIQGLSAEQQGSLKTAEASRTKTRYSDISSTINTDLYSLKGTYEASLKGIFGEDLSYDVSKTTMGHPLIENQLQCFSGSALHLALGRDMVNGHLYLSQDNVVIFEPGHILPGRMEKIGDEYHLYGIETTSTGDAIVDYGSAKFLSQSIRVVEADLFVLFEVIKAGLNIKVNGGSNSFVRFALERAALKYGIPLDQTESAVAKENAKPKMVLVPGGLAAAGGSMSALGGDGSNAFNSSEFAFGESIVQPGKRARTARGMSKDDFLKSKEAKISPPTDVIVVTTVTNECLVDTEEELREKIDLCRERITASMNFFVNQQKSVEGEYHKADGNAYILPGQQIVYVYIGEGILSYGGLCVSENLKYSEDRVYGRVNCGSDVTGYIEGNLSLYTRAKEERVGRFHVINNTITSKVESVEQVY
jgi:hypothetical protein